MFDFGTFDHLTFEEDVSLEQAGHGSGSDLVFPAQRKPDEPKSRRSSPSQPAPHVSPSIVPAEPEIAATPAAEALTRAQAAQLVAEQDTLDTNLRLLLLLGA